MKKFAASLFIIPLFILLLTSFRMPDSQYTFVINDTTIFIPLGGNSYITVKDNQTHEEITDDGWKNWQSNKTVFSTYIQVNTAGTLNVVGLFSVSGGTSKISCTIDGVQKIISISDTATKEYKVGSWNISKPGYVKIDFRGVEKTGTIFAIAKELQISGSAVNAKTAYVKSNEDNYFYWGRRGPSVHLNYDINDAPKEIEWFYNEINVPVGNDVIGSYFMANGFGEGYFGIQVNSATERRVLFSVWSPFNTDDPSKIPADKKILLLKKGKDVHTGEFGNEGSGGQSYLQYNWKAGTTYRFLLKGKPVANNYTNYTAYFFAPKLNKWMLIASFSRPATHTYLTRLHSFLENFETETGYISRKAFYQNQWIRDTAGVWKAISKATFTGDLTARKKYRMDYSGGAAQNRFFLRNCGFFNDSTVLHSSFSHNVLTKPPSINFAVLE